MSAPVRLQEALADRYAIDRELGMLVATGKLKYRETVAEGLAAAPDAFIGLLAGRNFGKQLVKLI